MKFEISHTLPADPASVADAILDPDFQSSLHDIGALESREVLSQIDGRGGSVVRRTRCVLGVDLGAAKRFLGSADPAWVEEATWDPNKMTWEWEVQPEVAEDLLTAEGVIDLEPNGDGTIRRVTGEVKVKVPIYGSKVESFIINGLESAYEEEAERLVEWLEGAQ